MTTPTIQPFNFDTDVLSAILWQWQNSPNLLALVQNKQDFYDQNYTEFMENFYTDIFNLQTANDFGLAIWSIILGGPISFIITTGGELSWGFGVNHANFNNGNFSGIAGSNSTYNLSTETSRVILQLQYFRLIGTVTVPAINRALQFIFADNYGQAYLKDNLNMTQEYIFGFTPPSDMQFAFNNADILPRPAGVGSSWSVTSPADVEWSDGSQVTWGDGTKVDWSAN